MGAWTGLTSPEIGARWPAELAAHRAGHLVRPPDGEDTTELLERVHAALTRLGRASGRPLLVVTHAGVIRSLEREAGATPPAATPNLGGRWFEWLEPGQLKPGEPIVPVDPTLTTAPPSR